ncbi:hypothetical protein ACP70R_020400 [Stipagrostis hirtigluma subsp. patula]
MGGWNRSWRVRRHHDGSHRPSRPPLPPPDYGNNHCSVPLWEREFCSYVGNISWQRFCENKQYVSVYNNLEQWDDSGAFENFQNVKARFWANYHGQSSDIPLPDRDMYIDKVDQRCKVDPELIADLDTVRLPFDSDNNLAPAADLGNIGAENKCTQNQSGNWDIYVEKPAEVNKWEDNSRSNLSWGVKQDSFDEWGNSNTGWGALANPSWHSSSNNHCSLNSWNFSKWGNSNTGWGDALVNPSWHNSSNNHCSSNNWNNFHGGSNNRYQEPRNVSGRKRDRGGYYRQRNRKQRNQAEDYQQDHKGRHNEWRPSHNRARGNGQGIDGGF